MTSKFYLSASTISIRISSLSTYSLSGDVYFATAATTKIETPRSVHYCICRQRGHAHNLEQHNVNQHKSNDVVHCDPDQGLNHESVQSGVGRLELVAWVRLRLGLGLVQAAPLSGPKLVFAPPLPPPPPPLRHPPPPAWAWLGGRRWRVIIAGLMMMMVVIMTRL